MKNLKSISRMILLLGLLISLNLHAAAQSTTASLSGEVSDQNGAVVPGANVTVENVATRLRRQAKTSESGSFTMPLLPPGEYTLTVESQGFAPVQINKVILNVGDQKSLLIQLKAGNISEMVKIEGDAPLINESPAVGTVVDRQFAENIPLNGRSFQTLIQLTPGVILTPSNGADVGQFSINGQRAASNYWTVDGVSANIGIGASAINQPGDALAGAVGSFSALGGTNSLVSVDALQEFHIQTSTYAPEFGRTPGGQISIVTRSGTNQFHGTAFEYFRNDILDANNWFANRSALKKPQERQNDFGGTFAGPIVKDKTFFFFSYEGLRLRLPKTALSNVPDLSARQTAVGTMQPFLNAFPLPNGTDNPTTGVAQFNATYSDPGSLDAYSLRVDQRLGRALTFFGRYNYSPSSIAQRGAGNTSLNSLLSTDITTHTGTAGLTWSVSSAVINDLRFNYSRTNASSQRSEDSLGGAVPLATLPLPGPFTSRDSLFRLVIRSLGIGNTLWVGRVAGNTQRQINIVDSLSAQKGSHSLKLGGDFRRLSPEYAPTAYQQFPDFLSVPSAKTGTLRLSVLTANTGATFLFRNLGLYAQDAWRVNSRLTLTYGLRWDVDFVPQSIDGPSFAAVTGFNLNDLSQLALAPAGTAPYKTTYGNLAPRLGLAFRLSRSQSRQIMLRGGFGVFYDLATSQAGNLTAGGTYPFGVTRVMRGGTFPLSPAAAAPPAVEPPTAATGGQLGATDPNLKLPYTIEWNVALEQALGSQQSVSASYIGASGRRLLGSLSVTTAGVGKILVANAGTSDYHALQVQFQRRVSHGLQALASYSWSHSIDTGSAGSIQVFSNNLLPGAVGGNRASSDFDIRHAFTAGITYDVPAPKINAFSRALLHGWSLQSIVVASSSPPVSISDGNFFIFANGVSAEVRPDIVPGQPVYLYGPQYPGGKAFNPAAFTDPPFDPITFTPLRQGNVPRNFLRGFGLTQWDFAVHRNFPIRESLKLQFRAEMFNVLNHPNFGPPSGVWPFPPFGLSTKTLNQYLDGGTGVSNAGGGAFNALHQVGGPRSIQFALKLTF